MFTFTFRERFTAPGATTSTHAGKLLEIHLRALAAGKLPAELKRANEAIGPEVSRRARALMADEIYAVPIPLTQRANQRLPKNAPVRGRIYKGVHGKWERKGDLAGKETWVLSANGLTVTLRNTSDHSMPRNALGGPPTINFAGRRAGIQRPQVGVPEAEKSKTRPIQWQCEAVRLATPWVTKQYKAAMQRAARG